MDQELKAFLEEREARMEQRMDERFAQMEDRFIRMEARMNERFEQVDTEIRHTRILVEAVHSDVRLDAEGVMGVSESQQALREETAGKLEEIKALVTQSAGLIRAKGAPHALEARSFRTISLSLRTAPLSSGTAPRRTRTAPRLFGTAPRSFRTAPRRRVSALRRAEAIPRPFRTDLRRIRTDSH